MALRKRPREPRSYASLIRLLSCKKPRAYDPSLLIVDEVLVLARKWSSLHQMSYYYDPDTLRAWARATRWMAHNREVVRTWLPEIRERAPRFFELQGGVGDRKRKGNDVGRAFEEYLTATAVDAERLVPEDVDRTGGHEDADRRTLEGRQHHDSQRKIRPPTVKEDTETHENADEDWMTNEIVVGGVTDASDEEDEQEDIQIVVLGDGGTEIGDVDEPMVGGEEMGRDETKGADEISVRVMEIEDGDRVMEGDKTQYAARDEVARQEAGTTQSLAEHQEIEMAGISNEVETADVRHLRSPSPAEHVEPEKTSGVDESDLGKIRDTNLHKRTPDRMALATDTDVLGASEILCGISHSPTRDDHAEECAATLASFKTSPRLSVDYKNFPWSHISTSHQQNQDIWAVPLPSLRSPVLKAPDIIGVVGAIDGGGLGFQPENALHLARQSRLDLSEYISRGTVDTGF